MLLLHDLLGSTETLLKHDRLFRWYGQKKGRPATTAEPPPFSSIYKLSSLTSSSGSTFTDATTIALLNAEQNS